MNKSRRSARCRVNNSVIFDGRAIGSEEFLSQMIEVLGITIDIHPKGRLRKRKLNYRKIGCAWVQVANTTLHFGN